MLLFQFLHLTCDLLLDLQCRAKWLPPQLEHSAFPSFDVFAIPLHLLLPPARLPHLPHLAPHIDFHGSLFVPARAGVSNLRLCFTDANNASLSKIDSSLFPSPLNITVSSRLLNHDIVHGCHQAVMLNSGNGFHHGFKNPHIVVSSPANPQEQIRDLLFCRIRFGLCTYRRSLTRLMLEVGSYSL